MVVFDSDKRYIFPFELVEKYLKDGDIAKIRADVKKEIRKL